MQPGAVPRSCSTLLRRAAGCRIPALDVLGLVAIIRTTFYPYCLLVVQTLFLHLSCMIPVLEYRYRTVQRGARLAVPWEPPH